MSVESWFSDSYVEARAKFLTAAADVGAEITSHTHPLRGPSGEPLAMDVARVGPPRARRLLVTISATHGVEGFCGSASQVALFAGDVARTLPGGTALLQVHAHNPHGFAHERRVTEGNVDLNRNFVDFSGPLPDNAGYDEIHHAIVPTHWSGPQRVVADVQLAAYVATHGRARFQMALTRGQYRYPDGLFFGGQEMTWSHRVTRELTAAQVAGRELVVVLDFHTGLGPRGRCELILEGTADDAGYWRARRWFGDGVRSPARGDSVSAVVTGSVYTAYRNAVGADQCTFITLEYGTVQAMEVLQALRADNWLYLNGKVSSELGRRIKRRLRRAFYGEDRVWKEQVLTRSQEVARTSLAGLAV